MTWKPTSKTTIFFSLSLNSKCRVCADSTGSELLINRCLGQMRGLFLVNNPLLGLLGPHSVLHSSIKPSNCVWARLPWPPFGRATEEFPAPCDSRTRLGILKHFGVRTPLVLYPLRTWRSFGLCELYRLVFAILEIKTEKWINHIGAITAMMSSHIM